VFISITDGKEHDVNSLDVITFDQGAFYVMDKGYIDYGRLYIIHKVGAFFVTRAKKNFSFTRIYSAKVDKSSGVICDQTIKLKGYYAVKDYPDKLRRIKYYDKELNRIFVFITNNFDIDAPSIAALYKNRWKIELFFKWIKQHLKIKTFWGQSKNAVYTQIWVAISNYALIATLQKKLNIDRSRYEILQILSVSLFDKTPINQLLATDGLQKEETVIDNQLKIF
jgi:IS4 transposase